MAAKDTMPAALAAARLTPFERWMVEQTVGIKADLARIQETLKNPFVVLKVESSPPCSPVPVPVPGTSPAPSAPILKTREGDSVTMIRIPVTLPAMPVNANGVADATLSLLHQETGAVDVHQQGFTSGGGQAFIDVADGSSGEAWCKSRDAAGNETAESVRATWTNAADGQASPAPAAPVLGSGDEAGVAAPVLGTMKKK